jgi:hypothetical protein
MSNTITITPNRPILEQIQEYVDAKVNQAKLEGIKLGLEIAKGKIIVLRDEGYGGGDTDKFLQEINSIDIASVLEGEEKNG